jgi:hypothetical protein
VLPCCEFSLPASSTVAVEVCVLHGMRCNLMLLLLKTVAGLLDLHPLSVAVAAHTMTKALCARFGTPFASSGDNTCYITHSIADDTLALDCAAPECALVAAFELPCCLLFRVRGTQNTHGLLRMLNMVCCVLDWIVKHR